MRWLLCLLLIGCAPHNGKDGVAGEGGHVVVTIDNETANDCVLKKQENAEVYVISCKVSSVVIKEKEECPIKKKEHEHGKD